MSTLSIEKKNAIAAYRKAAKDGEERKLLEGLFPDVSFDGKITDRIKTWEDVCEEAGEDPNDEKWNIGEVDEIGYRKAKLICKVLNEGWKPNWNNDRQYKWYPWFYRDRSGGGFRFHTSDRFSAVSGAPAWLCYASSELSDHAAKYFLEIYKQLMTNGEDN